jgi:hypothetical protein
MSTPNPIEVAAIPTAIAALQAVKQFSVNMGADPAQWALKYPGASTSLLGQLELLLPGLAVAEGGAVQTAVNTKLDGWITDLQGKLPK